MFGDIWGRLGGFFEFWPQFWPRFGPYRLCFHKRDILERPAGCDVNLPDAAVHCYSAYFLSGYLAANPNDNLNFPPDQFPAGFERYEVLFHDALFHLKMTKQELRAKQEFNFDSGDANNLESAVGVLRVAIHLGQAGFSEIVLIRSNHKLPGADLTAKKNGHLVCFEVKTITKSSTGKKDHFFADQLYEKIKENIARARKQLTASSAALKCDLTIYTCVVNWLAQTVYLNHGDFQEIVNKLEEHGDEKSLQGVDGVWFVLKNGSLHAFLNDKAKVLDSK